MENQPFTLYKIAKLKNFVSSVNFAAIELQWNNECQIITSIMIIPFFV